jgi:surface antigen
LVGIIDTGVSANNPDLNYSNIILGTDYVDGDDNPLLEPGEGSEHGTHVLGIISTTQDNGIGIDGVNDEAPIWVGRAVGSGQWTESLVEFVNVARDSQQPNAVVNLSLDLTQVNPDGSVTTRYEFTPQERAAIEYARQYNVLIVAAAGNDGGVMSVLGQASQEFDNIITVGSAQDFDSTLAPAQGFNRADYSSYGYGLDIMANGATIDQPVLSTVGDGVGTMAGTSVATAQVTGAVSQVWAANPQLSYRQVIEIIKSTATDLDTPNWDVITGAGLLNLNAAVLLAKVTTPQEYEVPATVIPETWSGEGRVTPSERAAAVPMWPTVEPTSFTGRVMATAGANVRSGPGTSFSRVGSRGYNSSVTFDGWTYGERITDIALGTPDERWYRIAGTTNQWIASAIIDGNAPGSTPLPPDNSGGGTPLPQPQPSVPINGDSPNYRNGSLNPFAQNPYLIGQCTWYAYGRMLETGLLPPGAKANGWFLGNAEAWRRDAARAGLPVSSTPTPGARSLVVWPPGVQGGHRQYGHVAFVEEVYPDGRIRISESNWDGKGISERTLTPAQYSGLAFVRLENATPTPSFSSPPAQPGKQREYRVRPADTLSGIAYRELGNANRWREITKADGSTFTEAEARRLQVGMSVYLPVSYQTKPTNSSGGIIVEPISFIPPFIPLPRPGTFDPKSPKGYDRSSAVRYAKEYADNKGNPKYHYFEYYEKCLINWPVPLFCNWVGGDCTNFVSQCLIEGGVLSLKEATEKEEGGKIYLKNTFTVVDKLIDHLLKNKLASDWDVWNLKPNEKFDKISQLLHPGDIIAFELNNDPNSPRDHLAVFMGYQTDKDGKRIAMGANHTLDGIRPIPLDKVRSLIRIDDSLGFNWV